MPYEISKVTVYTPAAYSGNKYFINLLSEGRSVMATAGLVLGIIGFLSSFLLVGMLFSAAGLAISALAMSKGGGSRALLGLLFSIAGLLLPTIFIGSYITASPEQKSAMVSTLGSVLNIDPSRFGASEDTEIETLSSEPSPISDTADLSNENADEDRIYNRHIRLSLTDNIRYDRKIRFTQKKK